MSLVHRTVMKTIILPCDGEERTFKNTKQGDMFLRLHKKKCERCRNASYYTAHSSHFYNTDTTTSQQVHLRDELGVMATFNALN